MSEFYGVYRSDGDIAIPSVFAIGETVQDAKNNIRGKSAKSKSAGAPLIATPGDENGTGENEIDGKWYARKCTNEFASKFGKSEFTSHILVVVDRKGLLALHPSQRSVSDPGPRKPIQ